MRRCTCPSADRDLLMVLASSNCCPEALDFLTISLPARSTSTNLPDLVVLLDRSFWFTVMVNTEWDLEEPSFMPVAATALLAAPETGAESRGQRYYKIVLKTSFRLKNLKDGIYVMDTGLNTTLCPCI